MFRFKQFDIIHERTAQKVTTDSVLLGAWTISTFPPESILDIGAGTGLLSLMAAQKWPAAKITALEIDVEACEECNTNFKNSKWADHLEIVNCDFASWSHTGHFDLILSNPPYFNENVRTSNASRDLARYAGNGLSMETLLRICPRLLTERGSLSIVFPASQKKDFDFLFSLSAFKSCRFCIVKTVENKPPKLILAQMWLQKTANIEQVLTIRHAGGEYTTDYLELTKDFYLFNH